MTEIPALNVLRRAIDDMGGSHREGQEELVRAAATAIDDDGVLLAQAGTGTGKSLAYLSAALTDVVAESKRVVISTATLALQRQIVEKDGPRVAAAVEAELGRAPSIAVLKGWQNYICRHKLAGGYPQDDELELFGDDSEAVPRSLGGEVVKLRKWAEETDSGDRDDIPGISERAWRQVSVSKLECLGPKCQAFEECFAVLAKDRAFESDVVVTNHAMLGVAATGSPGALPERDILVIDEAHELTSRVTGAATQELSAGSVSRLARAVGRLTEEGVAEMESAAVGIGAALESVPDGRLRDLPNDLLDAVLLLGDAARSAMRAIGSGKDDAGARAVVKAGLVELEEICVRLLSDSVAARVDVAWVSRGMDQTMPPRLYVAPLNVAAQIRALTDEQALIATSATLQLGGRFDGVAGSLGLNLDDGREWTGEDFGSPFDYSRQAIIYVAAHLPRPGREGVDEAALEELAALIEAAGGGTLGLFSSRRGAERAADFVRDRISTPVFCQGDAHLPELVERFAADPDASLFGTLSLWQGIDIPGETCRLVVIDRIPFPRPDEPISSARSELAEARGGSGFYEVSVAHAALLLAQGTGRLIRGATDRGVVAILDPRLATANYGSYLMKSLPPMWRTLDRELVLTSLAALNPSR